MESWVVQHNYNGRLVRSVHKNGKVRSTYYRWHRWQHGFMMKKPKLFTSRAKARKAIAKFKDPHNWSPVKVERIQVWRIAS